MTQRIFKFSCKEITLAKFFEHLQNDPVIQQYKINFLNVYQNYLIKIYLGHRLLYNGKKMNVIGYII